MAPKSREEVWNSNPSEWHDKYHGVGDFCKRAKVYYCRSGRWASFDWLLANCDAPLSTESMDLAATNGFYNNVVWFHKHRFEGCTTAAMDGAATHGHLKTVQYLHENRNEGCTTAAMDGAATNGHLEMVKWLNENRTEGCTTAAMTESCEDTSPLQGDHSQQQR
ncbi:hypothetical protein P3T76_015829 [Phytophthora citrophthora]|uniref:Uncharacterized protein n=1 Tax=Phytophthora citrophthora TaxID=4793 RepID=A0AAD9FYP7_9STRA|nr:hypothetical protein P3T76_015829 [Phytophthora citrophthora]